MSKARMKRKMPLGEWLFLHLIILPAYLAVGTVMVLTLAWAFSILLPGSHP